LPAEDFLKGVVNRELAIGIAQRRLDEMKTGLTTRSVEPRPGHGADGRSEELRQCDHGRGRPLTANCRIAQQDRTRILAESAGEAAEKLLAVVTSYEQAVEAGTAAET
jgi:hypothetical protein